MLNQDDLVGAGIMGGSFGAVFYSIRGFVMWLSGRHDARQAKLDAEHDRLDQSWEKYRLGLEQRLTRLERQNETLRAAFQDVAAALIGLDPQNPALARASRLLALAVPQDFSLDTARAEAALRSAEGGISQ